MTITLDQLLASRDERQARQRMLLGGHPGETLLCLTVVMPGAVKRNAQSLTVAHAAVEALRRLFEGQTTFFEERDLPTGYEAYMLTSVSELEAKRLVCDIEENHPLGRLFDIDVISHTGQPISRTAVGLPARRCIICGEEARVCMRTKKHTQEELHAHIDQMISRYVHRV